MGILFHFFHILDIRISSADFYWLILATLLQQNYLAARIDMLSTYLKWYVYLVLDMDLPPACRDLLGIQVICKVL